GGPRTRAATGSDLGREPAQRRIPDRVPSTVFDISRRRAVARWLSAPTRPARGRLRILQTWPRRITCGPVQRSRRKDLVVGDAPAEDGGSGTRGHKQGTATRRGCPETWDVFLDAPYHAARDQVGALANDAR